MAGQRQGTHAGLGTRDVDPTASAVFQRRSPLSVGQTLALRAGLALGLMAIALFGHWFARDGLRDNIDGSISFIDVLYFTTVTVTTVGYGDIVPVTPEARLFDALVVTPIRAFHLAYFSRYRVHLRAATHVGTKENPLDRTIPA